MSNFKVQASPGVPSPPPVPVLSACIRHIQCRETVHTVSYCRGTGMCSHMSSHVRDITSSDRRLRWHSIEVGLARHSVFAGAWLANIGFTSGDSETTMADYRAQNPVSTSFGKKDLSPSSRRQGYIPYIRVYNTDYTFHDWYGRA